MKNKVLLISTCFEDVVKGNISGKIKSEDIERTTYPSGLIYLTSYLKSKDIETKALYLNYVEYEEGLDKINKEIKKLSPILIGLQLLSANRVSSYKVIEYLHQKYPKIKIVIGGIHSTIMYKQLIKKYPFLIIVLGEGEITLEELINELNKSKVNLKKIDGIAFWEDKLNDVGRTKPREVIKNLDTLPFPNPELFFKGKRTSACILTSRGCPFNCSFCVLNPEAKRMVRFRSPKNVVDEMEYLVNNFPQITEICIHDDSFFIDNERVIKICDEIIRRKIKTKFLCSGRIKPVSSKMIKKLEEANFRIVMLGIESGNNEILKRCHKGINQEDMINTFKLFAKSKITLKIFLIIGLPGETKETIKETAKFIQRLQKIKYVSSGSSFNRLMVYPGTEVYEIAKSKGMIDDSFWLSDKEVPLYTAEHSAKKLNEFGDILINHISYYKLKNLKGFKAQFEMIPYILKYVLIKLEQKYLEK
ncbi:B12-binding domain-containing radical SAM protein [Candidatus Pacearchaeota archaeon]|nr:B12-binding domain-containing radical SAM protein [Candidatus Pacearchaeota archaeon]